MQIIVKHYGRLITLIYWRNYENMKKEILYEHDNEFEKETKTSSIYAKVYIWRELNAPFYFFITFT